ncbi:MAG TPA: phage minor head protein [Cyanophyceae cyanobacterium]
MFDSTFSPIIAQFQEEEIPYADDDPILDRATVDRDLDDREARYAGLLTTVGFASTEAWWKTIEPALEKGDRVAIDKNPWKLSPQFQSVTFGLWTELWNLGNVHAVQELNIANAEAANEGDFFREERLALFRDYPAEDPVFVAYPPDYGIPLRDSDLRGAVEARTLELANDVDQKTKAAIQGYVIEAVNKHGASGIPSRDRAKLVSQINLALGRQSLRQIRDPNVKVGEPLVRTAISVPGTTSFASRARTIARTELSAAHSLGKLQVAVQANVEFVRWVTHPNQGTCKRCTSRNGVILPVDVLLAQHQAAFKLTGFDPTQYVIPAHPRCRCTFAVVLKGKKRDREMMVDPGRDVKQRQATSLGKAWNTLGNVAGVALTLASVARAGVAVAQEVKRRQQLREEEIERQKQEEAAKLARALLATGGTALSLGLLYMVMRQQQQKYQGATQVSQIRQPLGLAPVTQTTQPVVQTIGQVAGYLGQAQANVALSDVPVVAENVLDPQEQGETLRKLPAGLDLRALSQSAMRTIYGLSFAESRMVEELVKQYERDRATPPEFAAIPQFFLPSELMQQYPWLKTMPDIRNLTVPDLVRLGMQSGQAEQMKQLLQGMVRGALALPKADVDVLPGELMVGGVNLNRASVADIAKLLPSAQGRKRQRVAEAIYQELRDRAAAGNPITSIGELARIAGVGQVTVRNLSAQNYSQNLNNLLLQAGDSESANAIAGMLDIGPRLAAEIVAEFRERGQFGRPGVDPVEDLLARLEARVGKNRALTLTEETKNRIRQRLAGRMYLMPVPPHQPLTLPQTQSVGSAGLPPASSPLDVGSPSLPVTPQIAPGRERGNYLPTEEPSLGTIQPTGRYQNITMPGYVQPSTPVPGVGRGVRDERASVRREIQERFDDANQAVEEIGAGIADYRASLRETVEASKIQVGLKRKTVRDRALELQQKQEKAIIDSRQQVIGAYLAQDRIGTTLEEAESRVRRYEIMVEDLDDPLADDIFGASGKRKVEVDKGIKKAIGAIDQNVRQIDAALNAPTTEGRKLQDVRSGLVGLRDRVEQVISSLPVDSPVREQERRLLSDIERQISTIEGLTPEQMGDYAPDIRGIVEQVRGFRGEVQEAAKSEIISSIDGQIAAIDAEIARVQSLPGQMMLRDARQELLQKKQRLSNLPKNKDELSPTQRQAYDIASDQRERIKQANKALDSSLRRYRQRVADRMEELVGRQEKYESAIADWVVPGDEAGETLYDQRRREAVRSVGSLLEERLGQINQKLNQLSVVGDPIIGIGYVMQNLRRFDEMSPAVEGLTKVGKEPIGLDAAVDIRRRAVATLKRQLDYIPPSGQPGRVGMINMTEGILAYDTVGKTSRDRLQSVVDELNFWEDRRKYITASQQDANRVLAEIELLRDIDVIAYTIARSRLRGVNQEIATNQALLEREINSRVTVLQQYRDRLRRDLQSPVVYQINGQSLTGQDVRGRLDAARSQAQSLGLRRKDALEAAWLKGAGAGISSTQLQQMVISEDEVLNRVFTPQERQLLVEAVGDGQNGAFNLYLELAKLSDESRALEVEKNKQWEKIQDVLSELERKYGYRVIVRELPRGELEVSEPEDIETNPDRFIRGRPNPEKLLAKLPLLTGVRVALPVRIKDKIVMVAQPAGKGSYFDILRRLEENRLNRVEVDRRLEVAGFNRTRRLVTFSSRRIEKLRRLKEARSRNERGIR